MFREFTLDGEKVYIANLNEGSNCESHNGLPLGEVVREPAGLYEKVGLKWLLVMSG